MQDCTHLLSLQEPVLLTFRYLLSQAPVEKASSTVHACISAALAVVCWHPVMVGAIWGGRLRQALGQLCAPLLVGAPCYPVWPPWCATCTCSRTVCGSASCSGCVAVSYLHPAFAALPAPGPPAAAAVHTGFRVVLVLSVGASATGFEAGSRPGPRAPPGGSPECSALIRWRSHLAGHTQCIMLSIQRLQNAGNEKHGRVTLAHCLLPPLSGRRIAAPPVSVHLLSASVLPH